MLPLHLRSVYDGFVDNSGFCVDVDVDVDGSGPSVDTSGADRSSAAAGASAAGSSAAGSSAGGGRRMTGEPSVTIFVESEDADSSTFVGPLELFELFEVEPMALTPLRRGVIFPRVASSVPRRPASSLDPCLSSGSLVMRSYAAFGGA